MPPAGCPTRKDLSSFVLGLLSEQAMTDLVRHLDACPDCEAAVRDLDSLSDPVIEGLRRPPTSGLLKAGAAREEAAMGSILPILGTGELPKTLGDFRLLRIVGRGGMGVVFEAEQISLGRHVALKILPPHAILDPRRLRRFQREAKAAARLHHTNIVPVFGVGEADGFHYHVMQFIDGQGLDKILDQLRRLENEPPQAGARAGSTPQAPSSTDAAADSIARVLRSGRLRTKSPPPSLLEPGAEHWPDPALAPRYGELTTEVPPGPTSSTGSSSSGPTPAGPLSGSGRSYWHSVARIGIQAAEALAYAHRQGIVHRDIKPSNLLLDSAGTVWVTDFGLAKEAAEQHDLTYSGELVGTLRYIAPERFQEAGTARSDIYSLGLTLYEMLTLRPAFPEPDRTKLVVLMMEGEPPRPRRFNAGIPRDLETIVLKAIARDPARRYAAAGDFADDLRRFLEDKPIHARRVGSLEKLGRWGRRNPSIAALLAALLFVFLAGFATVTWSYWRTEQARRLEAEQRDQAEKNLYVSRIAQARLEWQTNNVAGAERLLDKCLPSSGQGDLRGWEWHYLKNLCHAELLTLRGHADQAFSVAYSPDGRYLASGAGSPFPAPDGSLQPGEVFLWDAASGTLTRRLSGHATPVVQVIFSSDGKWLASLGMRGEVKVWDPASGRERFEMRPSSGPTPEPGLHAPTEILFSPAGALLAAASSEQTQVIDLNLGRVHHTWAASYPAFSPDGTRIAADAKGGVRIWETASGRDKFAFSGAYRAVFSPDGRRLITLLPQLRIWDATTCTLVSSSTEPTAEFNVVAFSPDGQRLVFYNRPNNSLTLRDAVTGRTLHQFGGWTGFVTNMVFHPDGLLLALTVGNSTVIILDASSGEQKAVLRHPYGVTGAAFSPDGTRLASASWDGTVRIWDLTRESESLRFWNVGRGDRFLAMGFAADGRDLLLAHNYAYVASLQAWNSQTGVLKAEHDLNLNQRWVCPRGDCAFSADGRYFAGPWQPDESVVKVWDVTTGRDVWKLPGHGQMARATAFAPDGRRAVTAESDAAGEDTLIHVWELGTELGGELTPARSFVAAGTRALSVAFAPDSRRLVTCGHLNLPTAPNDVYVWDVDTGALLLTCHGHRGLISRATFSPDGLVLASAGFHDETIRLWDAGPERRGEATQPARVLPGCRAATDVTFSPDGRLVAAAGQEGLVHLWEAATGQEILILKTLSYPHGGNEGYTALVRFDPSGRRLAANSADGSVRIWEAPLYQEGEREERLRWARERDFSWHLDTAWSYLKAKQSYALRFHLDRLKWRAGGVSPLISGPLGIGLGRLYCRIGRWQDAASAFTEAMKEQAPTDPLAWFEAAYAYWETRDLARYDRLCRLMRQRYVSDRDPLGFEWTARACLLGPPGERDLGSLVKDIGVSQMNLPPKHALWSVALCRASRLEEAGRQAKASLAATEETPWNHAISCIVLALIQHRLQQPAEARRWLDQAVNQIRHAAAPGGDPTSLDEASHWHEQLSYQAIRREAEATLAKPAP